MIAAWIYPGFGGVMQAVWCGGGWLQVLILHVRLCLQLWVSQRGVECGAWGQCMMEGAVCTVDQVASWPGSCLLGSAAQISWQLCVSRDNSSGHGDGMGWIVGRMDLMQ